MCSLLSGLFTSATAGYWCIIQQMQNQLVSSRITTCFPIAPNKKTGRKAVILIPRGKGKAKDDEGPPSAPASPDRHDAFKVLTDAQNQRSVSYVRTEIDSLRNKFHSVINTLKKVAWNNQQDDHSLDLAATTVLDLQNTLEQEVNSLSERAKADTRSM